MHSVYLQNLKISGLGGVPSFESPFHPKFNILCGGNGIGKTTILEVIAHAFTANSGTFLRRNTAASRGEARLLFKIGEGDHRVEYKLSRATFDGSESMSGDRKHAEDVLFLTTRRDFEYVRLGSISRDPPLEEVKSRVHHNGDFPTHEIKQWLANRLVFSGVPKSLTPNQAKNQIFARGIFSTIDSQFEFERFDASTFDIYVKTPTGVIPYEYLSSGFRSCISLILGIVKEIEYRKRDSDVALQEFCGVVLIDELDMHLHPAWQQRIVRILRECFPAVQFIVTTHSPFVIQSADPAEVIVLKRLEDGGIERTVIASQEYGFSGWTIEEIAEHVLGVWEMRTSTFRTEFTAFQQAITVGNLNDAKNYYEKLDRMLHPENTARRLLRSQLDNLEVEKGDGE